MKPERLSREVVYQSPWVNLYLDKVRFPNGLVIEKFHLLDFPHAAVTAIVENGREGYLRLYPSLHHRNHGLGITGRRN